MTRSESGRPLTIKEKKALAEEQSRLHAEAKKNAKAQRSLTLLMMSFKQKLLDNKMEDESISDSMLAITVSQAKQAIKEKTFVRMIYREHNKSAPVTGVLRLNKAEFTSFVKVYLEKITDTEASELFNFLTFKKNATADDDSDNELRVEAKRNDRFAHDEKENKPDEKLDIAVLETHFEKWFREEDSLQAFLNPKVAKQRFADFKTKIEVWKAREKQRVRLKKAYKQHTQKLRQTLIEKSKRFTIENELVHQCMNVFDNLQEDLHRLQKEEKVLNDFLSQVPESFTALEVRELDAIADKYERAHEDNYRMLCDFV